MLNPSKQPCAAFKSPREHLAQLSSTVRWLFMIRFKSSIIQGCLLLFLLVVSACSPLNTVSKETQPKDNSEALRIILVDGREIDFEAGSYSIHRGTDSSFVEGVGVESVRDSSVASDFEGRLYFQDINKIQLRGSSGLTQVGTAVGVFALTLLALGIILSASGGPF